MEKSILRCDVAQSKNSSFVWGVVLYYEDTNENEEEDRVLFWARLKDLSGKTFLDHCEYSKSLENFLYMLDSLILSSKGSLLDLELSQLQVLQKTLYREYFDQRMMTPAQFMQLIYFLEGRKFSPNWASWLDVPMTVLQEMQTVMKDNPPITL